MGVWKTLYLVTTYRSNPDMVARRIRGESILVPISSTMEALDSIISLNETAEFIRSKAALGLDDAAICEAVMAEYQTEADEAATDVKSVLAELTKLGALVEETAT